MYTLTLCQNGNVIEFIGTYLSVQDLTEAIAQCTQRWTLTGYQLRIDIS